MSSRVFDTAGGECAVIYTTSMLLHDSDWKTLEWCSTRRLGNKYPTRWRKQSVTVETVNGAEDGTIVQST
ncbi:unnamed protein product [Acanthoscelides obtectus]|uniref:Uncharacterized protein n=1 Tax=Acanthoscelides obtectus TaxID=200917 RepID=A0A9P0L0S8_ACAOB|nr:unnamed protein product [Acanthoscelides obtectus]CAK1676844.1 hypothetical protein AOBTE_LOCUS30965 [Acanthoscelides obtectus]